MGISSQLPNRWPNLDVGKQKTPVTDVDYGNQSSTYKHTGVVVYNGIVFPPHINTEISYTPVYDDTGRQVIGTDIEVSVKGLITEGMYKDGDNAYTMPDPDTSAGYPVAGQSADAISESYTRITVDNDLYEIKNKLLAQGKPLQVYNKGLGNFTILSDPLLLNFGESTVLDISNGPKPDSLTINPINGHAVFVDWTCKSRVVNCGKNDKDTKNLMFTAYASDVSKVPPLGITYKTSTTVNENLTSSVTIEGVLKFPRAFNAETSGAGVVLADGTLIDSLDLVWRNVLNNVFEKTDQFTRNMSFTLSEDKMSLTFTINDKEIASDNPYPTGVADIQATHKIKSGIGKDQGGFTRWDGSLSVSIEAYPKYSKTIVWTIWAQLINSLINQEKKPGYLKTTIKEKKEDVKLHEVVLPSDKYTDEAVDGSSVKTTKSFNEVDTGKAPDVWLTSIDINDDIFSRKASINCNYRMITQLDDIMSASGILLPLNENIVQNFGVQWNNWSAPSRAFSGIGSLYQIPLDTSTGNSPIEYCAILDKGIDNVLTTSPSRAWNDPGISKGGTFAEEEKLVDDGYLEYDVSTSLEIVWKDTTFAVLEDFPSNPIDPNQVANKDNAVAPPSPSMSSDGYTTESTNKITKSSQTSYPEYIVTLKGGIHRIGKPAIAPELVGYGLKTPATQDAEESIKELNPVTKTGIDFVETLEADKMISLKDGVAKPTYITTFRKTYLIQGIPYSSDWISTGKDNTQITILPKEEISSP